jgi:hypothetical protein
MEGSPGVDKIARAKLSWLLILSVAVLSVFVFACGGGADDPEGGAPGGDTTAAQGEGLHTEEIPTHWAYGNANDLRTLLQASDEVFFGRVTSVLGQSEAEPPPGSTINRAGLPITSFEITVDSVLGGALSPGATAVMEQAGGTIETSDGATVRIVLEGDKLLENGAEYLFFADYKANGNLTVPPFGRLQVSPDGSLEPLPVWSELSALEQLTGLTASAAASRVEQAN